MKWQRHRRISFVPFYINTSRFVPTSWGIHEGPETYNVTKRRNSIRLPFGLGSLTSGGGRP
jgi:hypothetical protein